MEAPPAHLPRRRLGAIIGLMLRRRPGLAVLAMDVQIQIGVAGE